MNEKTSAILLNGALMVGMLLIMAMAVLPLLLPMEQWMRWVFAAGAALVLISQLLTPNRGANLRLRRLHRIGIIAALLYCVSAATTFYRQGTTDWVGILMAGAALQIYVSLATESELKRLKKSDKKHN